MKCCLLPNARRWRDLLLSAVLLFAVTGAAQADIPAAERGVLTALYSQTAGAGWTNGSNWNGAAGTECTWYGVSCDGATDATSTHVIAIVLQNNNLVGTLPTTLNNLPALVHFGAWGNRLRGSIPPLTGLQSLVIFDVSDNRLTGGIPALSGLTSLAFFDVDSNQLTGSIPLLAGLTSLAYLHAFANELSGGLPSLHGLVALNTFDVHHNQLTGNLPDLSELASLEQFVADDNRLAGPAPAVSDPESSVISRR